MAIKYPLQSVKNSVNVILNTVRDTSLNYSVQETPYSVYLSIRKSFSKGSESSQSKDVSETKTKNEIEILEKKLKVAEDAYLNLKNLYEEAVNECESSANKIKNLESEIIHFEEVYKLDLQLKTDPESLKLGNATL